MPYESGGTRDYFDSIPDKWHSRYFGGNSFVRLVNRVFRKAIYERYALTMSNCGEIKGATVLDIGCGTGLHSVEFARKGASKVVGIDFSPSMIEFSNRLARDEGLAEKCSFICSDFLEFPFEESFDLVIALGLFDYIRDPAPLFAKVDLLTTGTFLASFPMNTGLWALQRRIRYNRIKKCPVFEYGYTQLDGLLSATTFPSWEVKPMTRGLFAVARRKPTRAVG
ncbi:class I SAM-dependent methyltransferase [Thermodesulfobacteriota bacterium]